jgi:hypothetical protein
MTFRSLSSSSLVKTTFTASAFSIKYLICFVPSSENGWHEESKMSLVAGEDAIPYSDNRARCSGKNGWRSASGLTPNSRLHREQQRGSQLGTFRLPSILLLEFNWMKLCERSLANTNIPPTWGAFGTPLSRASEKWYGRKLNWEVCRHSRIYRVYVTLYAPCFKYIHESMSR